MIDDLLEALRALDIKEPLFGSIEIVFRDGKPFDIIKTERKRI